MIGEIIIGIAAAAVGGTIGALAMRSVSQSRLAASEAARKSEQTAAEAQKEMLTRQLEEQKTAYDQRLQEQLALQKEAAEKQQELYTQQLEEQKKQHSEQRDMLEKQMREQADLQRENSKKQYEILKEEFKNLAEKVLAEKSADFEKNGKTQLDVLLAPFKTKLEEFKNSSDQTRKEALENNAKLTEQINLLMKSSKAIGDEANQLAKALRSDNKMLGNWGEMILDEILTSSGLIEKVHYHKQLTLKDDNDNALYNEETGKQMRPDVVVNYPDGKVVIIDSKVSLTDYIDYVNSDDPEARENSVVKHIKSVKAHMDGLAKKDYSSYVCKSDQQAVEFVIMFMPNAGAYELAMAGDVNLWRYGFEKKILLVSPVNLMALLQLIHIGWKHYEQDRNQQKILDCAALLMDRLYKFYDNFDKVGNFLEKANESFTEAAGLLRGDNGKLCIVKKGQELAELGIKLKKRLAVPQRFQPEEPELTEPLEIIEISSGEESEAAKE